MRFLQLFGLLLAVSSVAAQTFEVAPAGPVLVGDPIAIALKDLPSGKNVMLVAERAMPATRAGGAQVLYRSQAVFAPSQGTLDLATAAPLSGSYTDADIRGLFWSMTPIDGAEVGTLRSSQVRLTASVDGHAPTTKTIDFIDALPEVKVEAVNEFPGAVFATLGGAAKRPAIIVLGGSEGGSRLARDRSPRLASRGFAVLGLPYYSPGRTPEQPDLPRAFADIPVERLNAAYEWLQRRDDVDPNRVAVYGVSKGAELGLIAASHFPWIKSVVAVVPTDVVWEGWGPGVEAGKRSSFALEGKPLSFVPYAEFTEELAGYARERDVKIRRPHDKGRAVHPLAAVQARIKVENFRGPLLLIAGHDDQIWASGMMAHNIAERRAASGLETNALIFADAGHMLSGTGWMPTTQYNVGLDKVGGTPQANAQAQARAFGATIEFFQRTLQQKSDNFVSMEPRE